MKWLVELPNAQLAGKHVTVGLTGSLVARRSLSQIVAPLTGLLHVGWYYSNERLRTFAPVAIRGRVMNSIQPRIAQRSFQTEVADRGKPRWRVVPRAVVQRTRLERQLRLRLEGLL